MNEQNKNKNKLSIKPKTSLNESREVNPVAIDLFAWHQTFS